MGLLDKIFGTDDDKNKRRADFSTVQGGSSSTAPSRETTAGPTGQGPLADVISKRTYTVKAGDSLSKIAKHEYGDAQQWHKIYEANRNIIKDPDLIYPGQALTLP